MRWHMDAVKLATDGDTAGFSEAEIDHGFEERCCSEERFAKLEALGGMITAGLSAKSSL